MSHDPVEHPRHYTSHPSGIECIQITEHMGFNLGNALKYVWRADLRDNTEQDLRKAIWYIEREIAKRAAKSPSLAVGGVVLSSGERVQPTSVIPFTCTHRNEPGACTQCEAEASES